MAPVLPPTPTRERVIGPDGLITKPWARWFQLMGYFGGGVGTGGGGGGGGDGVGFTIAGSGLIASGGGTTISIDALASDAQHGSRGGDALHSLATNTVAGFISGRHRHNVESLGMFSLTGTVTPTLFEEAKADAVAEGVKHIHFGDSWLEVDCGALTDDSEVFSIPDGFTISGNGFSRSIIEVVNTSQGVGEDGVAVFRTEPSACNVLFRGLDFIGDNGTNEGTHTYVLNNQNTCIDVHWLGTNEDILIRDCVFRQLWGFSVHDRGNNRRVSIFDSTLINCANGVNICSDWSIQRGCNFSNSEGFEASGKHIVIAGNTFRKALGNALSVGGNTSGNEYPGAVIVDNTVDGSTGLGATLTDGTVSALFANNTIRGCEFGGLVVHTDGYGPVEQCAIIGNVFDSNCASGGVNVVGLDVQNGNGKHLIYANTSVDRGISGYEQKYGLKLNAPDCVVSGNYFDGTFKDASFDVGATNTTERQNVFVNKNEEWLGTRAPERNAFNDNSVPMFINRVWDSSAADAYGMFALYPNGKWEAGPDTTGGVGLRDTNLYRGAANQLKTDDDFVAVGTVTGSNLSGTNTGNVTLTAVGSSPNANGGSLSGQALTLQPANASSPGLVSLGTQTLGSGTKTVDALVVTGNLTADTNTLFVDATNDKVGIGTVTPGGGYTAATDMKLHVLKSGHCFVFVESLTGSSDAGVLFSTFTGNNDFGLFIDESDVRRVKFAVGQLDTDANRNTNTRGSINQSGQWSLGHGVTAGYQVDLGSTLANTKLAIFNDVPGGGTSVVGFGVAAGDFRAHLDNAATKFSWRATASAASLMELSGAGVLNVVAANGITIGGVVVPTISSTSTLTNKTLTNPTINGASLTGTLGGSPNFSGSPTVGSAAIVTTSATQTLTNKTINGATMDSATAIALPAWTTLTLTSPWTNFGAPFRTSLSYRKDAAGTVFVSGVVATASNPGANSLIAQLPGGCRPLVDTIPAAMKGTWAAADQSPRINLESDGEIRLSANPGGAVTFLSLEFSFSAEQ